MSNTVSHSESVEKKKGGLKDKVIPLLTLLLVIAITVTLFSYRDMVTEFKELGYLGAFLVSLVANATILLLMPGILIISALGVALNPVLVGLVGAAGGAIGEMTGYMIGYSGRGIAQRSRMYARAEGWMRRWGTVTLFVFTLLPLFPFDVVGTAAGTLRYPIWKFLLVCWLGKFPLYVAAALAGAWGWELLISLLRFALPLSTAGIAALAVLVLLALALAIEDWTWRRGR